MSTSQCLVRVCTLSVMTALPFLVAPPVGAAGTTTTDAAPTSVVTGTPVMGATKVLELIVALGLVIAAVVALAWLAKRLQQSRVRTGGLHVEAAMPVGPKERVVIVEVDGQRLLLGVGGGNVRTLQLLGERTTAISTPASSANNQNVPGQSVSFAQMAQGLIGRGVRP